LSTAALTLLSPFAAFADEPTGPTVWDGFSGWLSPDWSRDFSATLGVKVWVNEWSRDSFITQGALGSLGGDEIVPVSVTDTAPDSEESDIEPVPIPQLSAKYKWLFVTGSYYSKTQFDFEPTLGTQTADAGVIREARFETSGERYEWDASGGIYVHPYVALLGGYKKVRQTIDQTITTRDFVFGTLDINRGFSNIDIEGPTIGIATSVPIGRGFGVYATYAHGFMDAEIRSVTTTPCCSDDGDQDLEFDADYDVAEAGFSYTHGMDRLMPHLPLSAATVYAGYRYQAISTDFQEQDSQDRSDVTRGFAVGVNLTF